MIEQKKVTAIEIFNGRYLNFQKVPPIEHKEEEIIYRDRIMTISTDGQQLFMTSPWWGHIKNSFFALERCKGQTEELHGQALLSLMSYNKETQREIPYAYLNSHNKANTPSLLPGQTYMEYLQNYYRLIYNEPITWKEVKAKSPRVIKMKLMLPGDLAVYGIATSEKEALHLAAEKVIGKLKVPRA
ncbi:MAG: hypothetical protein NTX91_00625 [candidate division SR1 bacterium]|nr:hypothetical protein [candidate division SR1 bacterium]